MIVSVDDKPMEDSRALSRAVGNLAPDTEVKVSILRKGKPMDITVKLGRLEAGEKLVAAAEKQSSQASGSAEVKALGMSVEELTDELRTKFKVPEKVNGVIVSEVSADGPAADKGRDRDRPAS